tara:strand:- start:215 stop:664 length:450 start_codon:yes stop_codon:yes gene_type:complete
MNYQILNNIDYDSHLTPVKLKFHFNSEINNINFSPYSFSDFFKKNISYNSFVYNTTNILSYSILDDEIIYLNKFYGNYTIKKKYLLKNIIHSNKYINIINILIINKRIEFLIDYLLQNNFDIKYLNYINNIIDSLYKNTNFIIYKSNLL